MRGKSRQREDSTLGDQTVWLEPKEEGREYLELKLERQVGER